MQQPINQSYQPDHAEYSPMRDALARTHLAGAILLAATDAAECNYNVRERHVLALVNPSDPAYSTADILIAATWGLQSAQHLNLQGLATFASQAIREIRGDEVVEFSEEAHPKVMWRSEP